MQTLDAPVYEVHQDSQWYKAVKKRNEDRKVFFKRIKEEFGLGSGFSYYHSTYFGIAGGTDAFNKYRKELLKNPKDGFYPFRKSSKVYKAIHEMLEKIETVYPFQSHDEFGLNNVTASQWLGNRWFFGVRDPKHVVSKIADPIDYKDYLKIVMENIE